LTEYIKLEGKRVGYYKLDGYIAEMSPDKLRDVFGENPAKSDIMRTIVMNEKEFISINYSRSQRSLWYSTVKPTLEKLGVLEGDQKEKTIKGWDKKLSKYLAELVREGYVTYKELNIIDESRKRSNPHNYYTTVDSQVYGYQINNRAYPNIIISTEKDTVYSIINNMAGLLGCSCISGKGQNSLGAMEDLIRGMRQEKHRDIYILTLTDYDPSGYSIAETFRDQVNDLKQVFDIESEVHIKRIGILPEQLSPKEVQNNKFTPPKGDGDQREIWFKKTGGIDGEPKGLELDALSPDRIRQIFIDNIQEYIEPDVYNEFIKESYIKKEVLESLKDTVNSITQEVIEKLKDEIEVYNFDVMELAQEGKSSLPIYKLGDFETSGKIKKSVNEKIKLRR